MRNPMYTGVLLLIIGEAILFRSSLILIYAALVILAFHLFVTLYEEPTLKKNRLRKIRVLPILNL